MWWSFDNKRRGISWGNQWIARKSLCPIFSSFKRAMWSDHAWYTEYHIKLATVTDHHMWDQFHEHGPCVTTSKNFCLWILCFSLSLITLALLLWFHNLCTTTRSIFWLLCYDKQAHHSWGSFPLHVLCLVEHLQMKNYQSSCRVKKTTSHCLFRIYCNNDWWVQSYINNNKIN